jgi:hypothetical protein
MEEVQKSFIVRAGFDQDFSEYRPDLHFALSCRNHIQVRGKEDQYK